MSDTAAPLCKIIPLTLAGPQNSHSSASVSETASLPVDALLFCSRICCSHFHEGHGLVSLLFFRTPRSVPLFTSLLSLGMQRSWSCSYCQVGHACIAISRKENEIVKHDPSMDRNQREPTRPKQWDFPDPPLLCSV